MEIVLKNITYRYHDQPIFTRLNLTLSGPKIIGLMGENKTQLLNLIDATRISDKGSITLGKDTLNKKNLSAFRRKVALVTQEVKDQFFMDTIEDEMRFLLTTLKYKEDKIEERITGSLKIVGLSDRYRQRNILELSSSEQKLVQLAVALLYNPKVILLDEPMIYLDYPNKKRLLRLLKQLKEKYKKTIIIASNDSNLLYSTVEELVILHHQKGVVQGDSNTLFQDSKKLAKYGIEIPYLVDFTNKAKELNVRLSYHKDIRDIIKDIYKHVDR